MFLRGWLILREGGQGQCGADAQAAQQDMLHGVSPVALVCLVYLVYSVCLVYLVEPDRPASA
jgi:hypothetical protein